MPISNHTLAWAVTLLVAYLLGSIPNGLLVARAKGVDIRKVGSGNIGATNVLRTFGKGWGFFTFGLDAAKGLLASTLIPTLFLADDPTTAARIISGCMAIVGHNWPVFLKFKGGKGVATSAGVILGIAPIVVGIGLAIWAILFFSTGYVAVGSIGAALGIAVAGWFLYAGQGWLLPVTLTLLAGLVLFTHRANIRRLLAGEENRFGHKKKSSEASS
jgi:glycerol-3-phosphate acyltransferase PlsY